MASLYPETCAASKGKTGRYSMYLFGANTAARLQSRAETRDRSKLVQWKKFLAGQPIKSCCRFAIWI